MSRDRNHNLSREVMSRAVNTIVKRITQRTWSMGLCGRVISRTMMGRPERASYMCRYFALHVSREYRVVAADTDVIVKRGVDTIRICVVPTKTNAKVI